MRDPHDEVSKYEVARLMERLGKSRGRRVSPLNAKQNAHLLRARKWAMVEQRKAEELAAWRARWADVEVPRV